MRKYFLWLFLIPASPIICSAQKKDARESLLQKYFLSLPGKKELTNWIAEIATNNKVRIDSAQKTDSANQIFLRGYINSWPLFERLDSIKFYVGLDITRHTNIRNRNVLSKSVDSSLYLREIFYFPLSTMPKKDWEELTKAVIKAFKKEFAIAYPNSGITSSAEAETVWFPSNYKFPIVPVVSMEYGKIEERSLYYIILHLNIRN